MSLAGSPTLRTQPDHRRGELKLTVWIAGVGMTPFGIHTDQSVKQLTKWAVHDALADAGCPLDAIGAAFFGSTTQGHLEGQLMIAGEVALRSLGLGTVPVFNIENACATGLSGISLACAQLRAGDADVVLVVGVEKMNVGDSARTMSVFDGAYDISEPDSLQDSLSQLGGVVDTSAVGARSIMMDVYAAMARNHMRLYGTTAEQIAAVAAKNHRHGVGNPRAHFRKDMSIEQILSARKLAYPLTVPMCAPITDGAAAVLLCSDAGLRKLGQEPAVKILAASIGTGCDRDISTFDNHVTARTAHHAYDRAGISPDDVDVAEVHDATAFAEVLQTELLGLVPAGDGGPAAQRGDTTLGGRIPVNPSGGLESKGHPLAATGIGQVFEITNQLRGRSGSRQVEDARTGVIENGGGFHNGEEAVVGVAILQRQ
ncbi:thiolase family protein [Nocardia sp. NPDC005745]|uniref:thiolase family protein n=1 Tax=Nocardia sp. NPDC005745 TaxID=3157061 RepID=UPI0033EBA8C2